MHMTVLTDVCKQNFDAIRWTEIELQQNKISIEFVLQVKTVNEICPRRGTIYKVGIISRQQRPQILKKLINQFINLGPLTSGM